MSWVNELIDLYEINSDKIGVIEYRAIFYGFRVYIYIHDSSKKRCTGKLYSYAYIADCHAASFICQDV